MLINYSNHPSARWTAEQIQAAQAAYGDIYDIPFPAVPVELGSGEVLQEAMTETERILKVLSTREDDHNAVMCQGEFTLTFAVTALLQKAGVRVVCAVSDRVTRETVENGVPVKVSEFRFAGFRVYADLPAVFQ